MIINVHQLMLCYSMMRFKLCLRMHFPNASIPGEIPASLDSASTNGTTVLEGNDQLV